MPSLYMANGLKSTGSAIRERRRTLHTISELSQDPTLTDGIDPLPSSKIIEQHVRATGTSAKEKRRSLPTQGLRVGYDNRRNPSILVTPTDPLALRRSPTDPNRLSARPVPRARHQQGPPLVSIVDSTKAQARSFSIPAFPLPPQYKPVGVQAPLPKNITTRYSGDWDKRREIDRLNREQAIKAAKARREKGGLVTVGSPSSLPSLSPLPTAKAKEVYIRRNSSLSSNRPLAQLPQDVSPRSLPNRRSSLKNMTEHGERKSVDRLAVKRASLSALAPVPPERSSSQKSRAEASEPNHLYNASQLSQSGSPRTNVSSSELYTTFKSQQRYQRGRSMSSSSLSPSPQSSSSTNLLGASRGSSLSRPTSSSRTSLSSYYYAQQDASKGQCEVFPTLIDMIPPAGSGISLSRVQASTPQPGSRRSSLASQTSRRESRNRIPFHSASQSGPPSPTSARRTSRLPSGVVHRSDVDKRGPQVLRKREPSKSPVRGAQGTDSEKAAREKAREKVRERVRRANELEEKKEKELLKQEKKKRMSLLCGMFSS